MPEKKFMAPPRRSSVAAITTTTHARRHYLPWIAEQMASQTSNYMIRQWIIVELEEEEGFEDWIDDLSDLTKLVDWCRVSTLRIRSNNWFEAVVESLALIDEDCEFLVHFQDNAYYTRERLSKTIDAFDENNAWVVDVDSDLLVFDNEYDQTWYRIKMCSDIRPVFGLAFNLKQMPRCHAVLEAEVSAGLFIHQIPQPLVGAIAVFKSDTIIRKYGMAHRTYASLFNDKEHVKWQEYRRLVAQSFEEPLTNLTADPNTFTCVFGFKRDIPYYFPLFRQWIVNSHKKLVVFSPSPCPMGFVPFVNEGKMIWHPMSKFQLDNMAFSNLIFFGRESTFPILEDYQHRLNVTGSVFWVMDHVMALQQRPFMKYKQINAIVHSAAESRFLEEGGLPFKSITVLPVGIPSQINSLEWDSVLKHPYHFVCSHNVRGVIREVWPKILKAFPKAVLDVYNHGDHPDEVKVSYASDEHHIRDHGSLNTFEEATLKQHASWEICYEYAIPLKLRMSVMLGCIPLFISAHEACADVPGAHMKDMTGLIETIERDRLALLNMSFTNGECTWHTDHYTFKTKPAVFWTEAYALWTRAIEERQEPPNELPEHGHQASTYILDSIDRCKLACSPIRSLATGRLIAAASTQAYSAWNPRHFGKGVHLKYGSR